MISRYLRNERTNKKTLNLLFFSKFRKNGDWVHKRGLFSTHMHVIAIIYLWRHYISMTRLRLAHMFSARTLACASYWKDRIVKKVSILPLVHNILFLAVKICFSWNKLIVLIKKCLKWKLFFSFISVILVYISLS